MKKELFKLQRKVFGSIFPLVLFLFHVQTAYSESYTLSEGESVTISQTPLGGGYIDNVGLAAVLDPHLGFSKNYDGSATITVNSYFDYTATVQLVFIERTQRYYSGRYHTWAETYQKSVSIKCSYVAPKPNVKPTKVYLPERVRAPLNERVYIYPTYDPYGAQGTDFEWTQYQGTSTFAYMETTDGGYHVTGRSPGIGSLSVKVDNDNNLKASTIIEVVDPNYLPPDNVFLPSSIEISVGGHATLQPILIPENAATSYTWSSDNSNIASVSYGKVTGVKTGTTTIKVKTANDFQSECVVTVVASNGKDDEDGDENAGKGTVDGHEYVDLGLSVKWATCNVGATNSEEFGGYYAWGETSEKSTYSWNTYSYGTYMNEVNIGSDIKGTKYDVAHEKWGSKWRMPTEKEFSELYTNCSIKKVTRNSVEGYEFTANNGNSIFLPAAGYKDNSGFQDGLRYWSSNVSSSDPGRAWYLMIKSNKYNEISYSVLAVARMTGLPIRPVTEESGEEQTITPTGISVYPSSKTIKVGDTFTVSYSLSPSNASTTVTWSSDDTSIATVSSSGTVTGQKAGTTYINATTSNGITSYCKVTVESGSTGNGIAINSTNFPDDNFRQFLLERDFGKDGVITTEEIEKVTMLLIESGVNIKSLKGIEYFSKLKWLRVGYGDNSLESLDVSQNLELETLQLFYCDLPSIDVSSNINLKSLDIWGNPITSLDVSNNPNLVRLDIIDAHLTSIDVSKNPLLEELRCGGGSKLTSLDVSKNKRLISLLVSGNDLSSIDVSVNTDLEELDISGNQITSLDVSRNIRLKELDVDENPLSAIDVTNNIALITLSCYNTNLTSLDISNNTQLEELRCNHNQLTSLDISKQTELKDLVCSENALKSLDVSKNKSLRTLFCAQNQLTSLDVSSNPDIYWLWCGGNHIISLDVSNNKLLERLEVYGNNIKGSDMDDLINSLPRVGTPIKMEGNECKFIVVRDYNENNVCTTEQVAAIKTKGWIPYNESTNKEYSGNDPSGIEEILIDADENTPVYDLSGKRLSEPRKGINIIGGKKVLVK